MEIIESLSNNRIKELNKLKEKKYRDISNTFIVEGEHLVNEAYKMNQLVEVYTIPSFEIDVDVPIYYVKENVLNKVSELANTKVIGVCKKFKPLSYGNRIIVLDNLQDPGNLGTIIRSAAAFNIDTVILTNNCVDLYNSKVVRATQGLLFSIDVMEYDLDILLQELKENDYFVYGTDVVGGQPVDKVIDHDKLCFIIGNEGNGISEKSKKYIKDNLYIPMNRKCESLNASVAASIIMYELSKNDYEE